MRVFTETEHRAIPGGSVRLLGAAHQVTGAATLVEQDGARVLVDCGLAQGRDAEPVRLSELGAIDAVVLTHGHLDHIGGLPELLDRDARAPIYATAATLDIARLSLRDSLSLERADRGRVRATLQALDERARHVPYDHEVRLGATRMRLREAGHILGSASVDLCAPSSRVIVSGDLGRPHSPILRDYTTSWDEPERPVDLAVIETTYGGRTHESSSAQILATLERVLRRAERDKGKVYVPAFAIGRTQVLLYYIDQLVESGRLQNTPVAVDTPLGLSVTETYKRFRKLYDRESLDKLGHGDDPLDFDDLFAVPHGRDSFRLEDVEGPLVIIAGSGMCSGGRIVHHLQAGMGDPRNTLLFVGYQARGTPGAKILDAHRRGERSMRFFGQTMELGAKIEVLHGLSAHADRDELASWVHALPSVQTVLTHHGEPAAQRAFAEHLLR